LIVVKFCRTVALLLAPLVLSGEDPGSSAVVSLSAPLAQWKREIEAVRHSKVVLARIFTDQAGNEIILPQDAEERPILRQYFLNPAFIAEFVHMQAATLNYKSGGGMIHFILLNMARAEEWDDQEEAVLAHEFGHVWLFANNYPAPAFEGKADSCVAILAGDAVQHVLIREEMRRRGIDYLTYWTRNLETQLESLDGRSPDAFAQLPLCREMTLLTQWLDVRLGLSAGSWGNYGRFLEAMARSFPRLRPHVEEVERLLRGANLGDIDIYTQVLRQVLVKMYAVAESLRPSTARTP
jgi:hypothetical protein